jgi:hypothetical protein
MNDNFKEILNSAIDLAQKKEGGMIFIGFEEETDKKRILAKISEEFTQIKHKVFRFNISQILSEQDHDQAKKTCMLKIIDEILHDDNIFDQNEEIPDVGINNGSKDENLYKNVKIQWESEERNDAEKVEFYKTGENIESQPIEMKNIENMINTLKDQLSPLINKIPELFGNNIDKNENIVDEVKINNENKIESETGAEEKESSTDDTIFNPISLLEGLFKNLGNIPDVSESSIKEEKLNENLPSIKNELTEKSRKSTSNPNENQKKWRNNLSEDLGSEEESIIISKIIDGLKIIPAPSVLILDEIDCAEETTFDTFNEILMLSNMNIPIIIGSYMIRTNGSPRGIKNKYLRMLLTKFKIDKIGKNFIIKKN